MANKINILFWIGLLAWISVILIFSSQTGSQTGELSGSFAQVIAKFMHKNPTLEQINSVNLFIRKLAHIAIFMILAILSSLALISSFSVNSFSSMIFLASLSCLITFALSFFDEWRKQFIDGRHFDLSEVALNALGSLIGVILVFLIYWIYKNKL